MSYHSVKNSNFESLNLKPLQVNVEDFNSFEEALKYFRLQVNKERIFSIIKQKSAYEKPSERKRRKKREASHRRFLESLPPKMITKERLLPEEARSYAELNETKCIKK